MSSINPMSIAEHGGPRALRNGTKASAFSRQLGAALAIPTVTSTLQNFMKPALLAKGVDGEIAKDAVGYILRINGDATPFRAYVAGCRGTFEVMTGIAGLGLLLNLVIKHMSIDQQLDLEHTLSRSDEKVKPDSPA